MGETTKGKYFSVPKVEYFDFPVFLFVFYRLAGERVQSLISALWRKEEGNAFVLLFVSLSALTFAAGKILFRIPKYNKNEKGAKTMYEILIGSVITASHAQIILPQINSRGFECYEINYDPCRELICEDMSEEAKRILDLTEGRPVTALGLYGNMLCDPAAVEKLKMLIRNAKHFHCNTLGIFAGRDPQKSVPDSIPKFKEVFTDVAKEAEANGVRLAFEGCHCGGRFWGGGYNIAFCPKAWDLMFDAVPSEALGLEWEPCHALELLADPVSQLRRYVNRVYHIHGKDATVDWDVIRDYGLDAGPNAIWNRHPGFGDTNWADLFTILLRNGYRGGCDIEGFHDPVHNGEKEWATQVTAMQYLKRCRGGEEFFTLKV